MLMAPRTVTQYQRKGSNLAEMEAFTGQICVGPSRAPLLRSTHVAF